MRKEMYCLATMCLVLTIPYLVYGMSETDAISLLPVLKGKKWGYVSPDSAKYIPFDFDGASYFSEGLAPVVKNGKVAFIDESGSVVIPFEYGVDEMTELPGSFSDGLAVVRKGKVGIHR